MKFEQVVKLAMDKTVGYPGTTWYLDPLCNTIINEGVKLGWLFRPSTTQVEWTEKGVSALKGEVAMKIYIVIGEFNGYDGDVWDVAAYKDRAKAEEHRDKAQARSNKIDDLRNRLDLEHWVKEVNEYDSNQAGSSLYSVIEMDVIE